MRTIRYLLAALAFLGLLTECGLVRGPVGSIAMTITDAKPLLPEHVVGCLVTIDAVHVRRVGGDWERLTLARTPYTIDLLQVTDGRSVELVPVSTLPAGDYTQVRLSVSAAVLRLEDGAAVREIAVAIPSENRLTASALEFDLAPGEACELTVDFDLSRSVTIEGRPGAPVYTLRPVLHLMETEDAATIQGTVDNSRFVGPSVEITIAEEDGRPYTRVQVDKDPAADETEYVVAHVVPGKTYQVSINTDPAREAVPQAQEIVETEPGEVYDVNF